MSRNTRTVKSSTSKRKASPLETEAPDTAPASDPAVGFSNLPLRELFEQQARNMLERADLDEEQKQTILVAMSCPCCGAGGISFSVKLKPE